MTYLVLGKTVPTRLLDDRSTMADEDLFPKRRNRHLNKRENGKEKLRESERGEERMRV